MSNIKFHTRLTFHLRPRNSLVCAICYIPRRLVYYADSTLLDAFIRICVAPAHFASESSDKSESWNSGRNLDDCVIWEKSGIFWNVPGCLCNWPTYRSLMPPGRDFRLAREVQLSIRFAEPPPEYCHWIFVQFEKNGIRFEVFSFWSADSFRAKFITVCFLLGNAIFKF